MKTILKLIALFSLSILFLGIAAINMNKLGGVIFWAVMTFVSFVLLFKGTIKKNKNLTKKTVTTVINELAQEEKENTGFIPWYEEELLWQGKRKIYIRYQDRNFNITERNIDMVGIWPNQHGEVLFRGFCHLRSEWRTFYADRVIELTTARRKKFSSFHEYIKSELGF
ncbi:WYL domain-containing protein [Vibrio vulnificus]